MSRQDIEADGSEAGRLAERIQLAELALRRVMGAPEGFAVQVQLIGRGQGGTPPRLNLTRIYRRGVAELCVGFEAGLQPAFPVVVDSTWVSSFELRPLGARGGIYPFEGVFELEQAELS